MERSTPLPWWQRLLLAFAALVITLVALVVFFTVRDYVQSPRDFQWGNGGEEQMVFAFGYFGGLGELVTYVLFVVPLVLLWPVRSQLKHWYAPLLVSLLWLPPVWAILSNARPGDMWRDFRHPFHPDLLWLIEPFAPVACGLYLLLLHRLAKRAEPVKT